jgi:hypothetical protein
MREAQQELAVVHASVAASSSSLAASATGAIAMVNNPFADF